MLGIGHVAQILRDTRTRHLLTPCSSSFISWSVTLGVLIARRRQCTLSSGTRYSRTSLSGRPRARPCLDVEGTASSRMEPLRVLSCSTAQAGGGRQYTEKRRWFKYHDNRQCSNKKTKYCDVSLFPTCGNWWLTFITLMYCRDFLQCR